jgi:hypothetical protein
MWLKLAIYVKEFFMWSEEFGSKPRGLSGVMETESHYRVHNNPPLVPNLSQMNPVQALPQHYLKSILILSSYLSVDYQEV